MAEQATFDVIMLVFRVLIGATFFVHGWKKRFGPGGIDGTGGWFESQGMRPGKRQAVLASSLEMGSGVVLALGLVTPFVTAVMIGLMVVAGMMVHRGNGFLITGGGWEYTFVMGLIAATIGGFGPGRWSIDNALGINDTLSGWTGLAIALVLGIAVGMGQVAMFTRSSGASAGEAAAST